MQTDFNRILDNLKKKVYHPLYLLQGEEPYFIDRVSDYLEKDVLADSEKSFNLTIFYGKDSDYRTIAEAALRFPMMADRQVVIVKEAQALKEIEKLEKYASKPMASTLLVLNYKYKKLNANTKLARAIDEKGVIMTSKKIYEDKIPAWIEKFLKKHEFSIAPQAAQILTAYLGNDLGKVSNELNKLMIALKEPRKITPADIEKNIGLSKDFNLLELQDALANKNIFKANQIIHYFGANPVQHPIQRTTATLFTFFSKIFSYHFLKNKNERSAAAELKSHPFYISKIKAASRNYSPAKLYQIIGILREYDMKSKGVDVSGLTDSSELQKEMIYKILH